MKRRIRLRGINGDVEGKTWDSNSILRAGRLATLEIVLDDSSVSRRHAEVRSTEKGWRVRDLGSTNGTYLNGHMIRSRQLLRDTDALGVGNFRVQFLAKDAPRPRSPADDTRTMSLDSIGFPGTGGVRLACMKVLNGSSAGLEVPVVKAVTTFGQPGVSVVSISHRRDGYYVTNMEARVVAALNGKPLGKDAHMLAHNDVLNLAGTEMQFMFMTI